MPLFNINQRLQNPKIQEQYPYFSHQNESSFSNYPKPVPEHSEYDKIIAALNQINIRNHHNQQQDNTNENHNTFASNSFANKYKFPKWKNLNFSGSKGSNVSDFIFRFETLARRCGYNNHMLDRYIFDYVSGDADTFLWNYVRSNPTADWNNIKLAMLSWFTNPEEEAETRRYIYRRVQTSRETVQNYILDVEIHNNRLIRKLSEPELLDVVKSNLLPVYRDKIMNVEITSINQLRILTQSYENLWTQSGYDPRTIFLPKRMPYVNELQPPSQSNNSNEVNYVEAVNNPQNKVQFVVCWNCKDLGHYYQDCPHDLLHVFCFGCGKEKVKKINCLHCKAYNNSENIRSSFARTGLQSSQQNRNIPNPIKSMEPGKSQYSNQQ